MLFSLIKHNANITIEATTLETSVGQATPAAPIFHKYTQMKLPTTLMIFIKIDTLIVIFVRFILRYNAAELLYTPKNGKDNAVIQK